MRRIIECEVNDEYVGGSGVVIGAAGSHNDVILRLKFSDMWLGLNLYAIFTDARGENSTMVMLMASMLVSGETAVYDVPVPAAAKKVAGKSMLTLSGYAIVDGVQEDRVTNTLTAYFRVMPSSYTLLNDNSIDATLAQQLQNEMGHAEEVALEAMANSASAAETAGEAKTHAQELSNRVSDLDASQAAVLEKFQQIKEKINSFLDVEDEAFDQLSEILKLIENNNLPDTAASISAVLYGKAQSLTEEQMAQARENIGVGEEYRAQLIQDVLDAIGCPVFGVVDENNNIVLTGTLPDGSYNIKYEMEDGSTVDIGDLVLDTNVYYSISNSLTNCVNSNSATEVAEGESYSATITANDGYELSSVVVTMGGAAVTVTNGVINIASVTGDIVITAVAEEAVVTPSYTNLLPLAVDADDNDFVGTHANGGDGYEYGYRVNSSGEVVTADGLYLTGFMPVTLNDIIRIKNITEYTADNSKNKIWFYDASKNSIGGTTLLVANTSLTVTDGIYSIRPSAFVSGSVAFFRFSCGSITDETIVTVNEEIANETTPTYTNQIPISIDSSGNLFVGTNGEAGYKTGYRISLSGGGESAQEGTESTGFIPANKNSILRIKNIPFEGDLVRGVCGYDANFNKLDTGSGVALNTMFVDNGTDEGNGVTRVGLSMYTHFSSDDLAYIRLCSTEITDASIITIDEEIV